MNTMMSKAALVGVGLATLLAQSSGQAQQATDALPYSTSYLVTGDYVAGGDRKSVV